MARAAECAMAFAVTCATARREQGVAGALRTGSYGACLALVIAGHAESGRHRARLERGVVRLAHLDALLPAADFRELVEQGLLRAVEHEQ